MAIFREFDETKGTVILKYKGEPLTPELNINDPKQLLEVLSLVIDDAYQKLRDTESALEELRNAGTKSR